MRIDTRAGSRDYIEPLRKEGLPVEPAILVAGDVEIMGRGPGGRIVPVGVEIKQWEDVMACVRNGRFADQLRGMAAVYEIKWLLIEGRIKVNGGQLDVRKENRWYTPPGHTSYPELSSWLLTMCQRGGVLLWHTESQAESVAWLRSLYWWWVSKDYEQHKAHLDFYQPLPTATAPWEEPSLVTKVASVLPHIGLTLAPRADKAFQSVEEMILADEAKWRGIEGVGSKIAAALVHAIRFRGRKST